MRRERLRIAGLIAAAGCAAVPALAQAGRGGITGTVTDGTGSAIPGVTVRLLDAGTGDTRQSVTNAAGLYSFISLNPGTYTITAVMKGFETVSQGSVPVSVDQVSAVNLTMPVGSASETVQVTSSENLGETSSSTVGQLLSAATIDRVPLLTRNVYDLVQLSAGVTPANGSPNSSSSFAINNISSGRPGVDVSSYTINGAIEGSVYFMVDGSPLGVGENNAGSIIPALEIPEDDVDEFRVETQNTPASYQSGGAGVISLATKSGTNQFHGDAFAYIRPDVLAGNDYFNKQSQIAGGTPNTAPDFHRYQEGGSIGGPILHNKLFIFGDYEATQQQQFDGSNLFTVPTTAERTGDFSADSFTIYNPMVADNADGTRQPFAGNRIQNPNPIAVNFLSKFPKCNRPSPTTCDQATNGAVDNLYLPGEDPTTAQRFDIRSDYVISDKQRLFGRFSFDRLFTSGFNAFNNDYNPFYAQNVTNGRNVLIGDDYTFNATTVLQLRYSFTRHFENQSGNPQQNGTSLTALGFPASLAASETYQTLPYILFTDVGGGIGGTADFNTFHYASENSDANGTVTKVLGKHELSFGGEYLERFLNAGQPGAPSGNYDFDISATDQQTTTGIGGSDFASLLIGMGEAPGVENTNFTRDLFSAEANNYYGLFAQDAWHPDEQLTVTAGLRWDIFGGRTERHNRLEYFDPTAAATFNGVNYTGAEIYANGSNRSPFATNFLNFGPRLGVTWAPVPHFVVRGGAGIYYGPSTHMVAGPVPDSDGFSSVTNWNSTCYNADGNTVLNGSNLCANAAAGAQAPSTTGAYSLSDPFPGGVVPTPGSSNGTASDLGTVVNTVLRHQRTQTTYNFNFGLEYQLPHDYVLSAAYVGSRGLFLPFGTVDYNQLDLATISRYGAALVNSTVPNTYANVLPSNNANYGSPTVPLFVSLEPFPQFGNGSYGSGNGIIVHGYAGGDSEYSSLQAKLQKRLTHHFTALASFTWAKLMTDDGNPPLGFVGSHLGMPQDWRDLSLEHSVSPQDVKYQFTGQASYDLPFGHDRARSLQGLADALLGEWTVNAIAYVSTGVPINSPLSGITPSYVVQRADLTCSGNQGSLHTSQQWFSPNCFALPASPFVAGTAPAYLDHVRPDGAQDVDLTFGKTFQFGEVKSLRLDVSSFNIENRPQFAAPTFPTIQNLVADPATYGPQFGVITSDVNTPRQLQFASRFTF